MKSISSLLSVVLVPLLITGQLPAQAPAVPPPPAAALHIRLLSADQAGAEASSKTPTGFTFEVTDAKGQPVPDAAVSLRLLDSGANGIFADGTHSSLAYTNEKGQAQIYGIRWSESTGTATMRVTATKDTAHAGLLLEQSMIPTSVKAAALPGIKLAEPASPEPTPAPAPAAPIAPASMAKPVPAVLAQPGIKQPDVIAMPTTNIPLAPRVTVDAKPAPIPPIASAASAAAPVPADPAVSVTNSPDAKNVHSSKTKWLILAAVVAAGGAAGALMMGKSKASTTSATTSSLSIGAPTVSIGH